MSKFTYRGLPIFSRKLQYHQRIEDAQIAKVIFNWKSPSKIRALNNNFVVPAIEAGFIGWPRKIHRWTYGKRVLDVGCGNSLHSIGFAIGGVKQYVGIDTSYSEERDWVKSKRTGEKYPLPLTLGEVSRSLPWVSFQKTSIEDFSTSELFDVVVLHNVTEHLLNLDEALEAISKVLRPSGRLVFHHHNFYSWDGHHLAPRTEDLLGSQVAGQNGFFGDWTHLSSSVSADFWEKKGLNRVRLDELHAAITKFFTVTHWDEVISPPGRGGGRLGLLETLDSSIYSKRELSVKNVLGVAQAPRAQR